MTTEELAAQEFWDELRKTTQARIGLGRAGTALPTRQVLELAAAHAAARDAVHEPLDVESFITEVRRVGIGEPAVVRSRATSRAEYLRRPDLGRLPEEPMQVPDTPADIGFVLADGLSPYALAKHGAGLLAELVAQLRDRYTLAPPVIATQARVGLGDHIAERAHVRTLLVVIGERPGLSVADSLGIYLTHLPRVGRTDADRNCISNIHPPRRSGLSGGSSRRGRSGRRGARIGAFGCGSQGHVANGRAWAAQRRRTQLTASNRSTLTARRPRGPRPPPPAGQSTKALACSKGAKLITGPTIFTGNNKTRIFQEKIFGPGRGGHVVRRLRRRRRHHAAFDDFKQSGIVRETHKMMLDHYQQTKTC